MKSELPSVKAEKKLIERKEIEEAKKKAEDKLRGHLVRTFKTPDGIETLRYLKDQCGFGVPVLGATASGLDEKVTMYQAMRLNLYLELRRHLPFSILKEAEYDQPKQ
mgnify:FL=1